MRSLLTRCLILILSLALAGGNATVRPHFEAAHAGAPCAKEHAQHDGKTEPRQHDNGLACCCDCLGCTFAAYLAPEPSGTSAELPSRVHYDAVTLVLSGRALPPEPDPPRPGTLS
jgi:hypothetical protein